MKELKDIITMLGKKVRVIDIDNIEYIGYFLDYTIALDNEENEWSIDIFPSKIANFGVELFESDIKTIDVVE